MRSAFEVKKWVTGLGSGGQSILLAVSQNHFAAEQVVVLVLIMAAISVDRVPAERCAELAGSARDGIDVRLYRILTS